MSRKRQDFHLTIVGLSKEMVPSVTQTVEEFGMERFVTFAGEVAPAYVSRFMHSADALVLFSNSETSSVVIHEAMASGLPIISTRVGAIPEIVNDTNGILVEPRDEQALADAILSMMSGEKTFNKDEIRAASLEFSYDSIGRQLMSVYNDILKEK